MSGDPELLQEQQEPGPGAMLARARAERSLTLAEVADRLKYAGRQIEALEADDYSKLPGVTFVRGMIRGYARLLEVDPAPALRALERRNIPVQAPVDLRTRRIPFPDRNWRATRIYLGLSLLALVAIGAVLYEWHIAGGLRVSVEIAPPQASEPAAVEPEPSATPEPPGHTVSLEPTRAVAPVAATRGHGRVAFEFLRESWVEVRDRAGKILHSQLNQAGTRQVVEGAPPFSIVIGNAAYVRLIYNDTPVDLKPYVKVEVARLTLD